MRLPTLVWESALSVSECQPHTRHSPLGGGAAASLPHQLLLAFAVVCLPPLKEPHAPAQRSSNRQGRGAVLLPLLLQKLPLLPLGLRLGLHPWMPCVVPPPLLLVMLLLRASLLASGGALGRGRVGLGGGSGGGHALCLSPLCRSQAVGLTSKERRAAGCKGRSLSPLNHLCKLNCVTSAGLPGWLGHGRGGASCATDRKCNRVAWNRAVTYAGPDKKSRYSTAAMLAPCFLAQCFFAQCTSFQGVVVCSNFHCGNLRRTRQRVKGCDTERPSIDRQHAIWRWRFAAPSSGGGCRAPRRGCACGPSICCDTVFLLSQPPPPLPPLQPQRPTLRSQPMASVALGTPPLMQAAFRQQLQAVLAAAERDEAHLQRLSDQVAALRAEAAEAAAAVSLRLAAETQARRAEAEGLRRQVAELTIRAVEEAAETGEQREVAARLAQQLAGEQQRCQQLQAQLEEVWAEAAAQQQVQHHECSSISGSSGFCTARGSEPAGLRDENQWLRLRLHAARAQAALFGASLDRALLDGQQEGEERDVLVVSGAVSTAGGGSMSGSEASSSDAEPAQALLLLEQQLREVQEALEAEASLAGKRCRC